MAIEPLAIDTATGALKTGATALGAYPGGGASVASETHAATGKTTPIDADELPITDSGASFGLKKVTWANLKATVKTYYDSVTSTLTNKNLASGTNTFPTFNQSTTGSAAKWTTARNLAGNSVDGSATVAFANKYIVQGTTDTGLSAAQFLGALGTGLVKNTTSTGVLSIATAGTDYASPAFINVKDAAYGAVGDASTNDTTAILAAIAALPAGGGCVFFPAGIYLVNTVASGVILKVLNTANVTLLGVGKSSIIRTSTASATELLRIEGCGDFTLKDLAFDVRGTAVIDKAVHYTCASPGSVHRSTFENLFISNTTAAARYVFDVMTTASSAVIYSGMAAFSGGDVGAVVTINYGNTTADLTTPVRTTISSVQTLSTTLSGSINSSVTTIPLTSALATMPTSGWSLKVGTEHMYVTAGGSTTSLTVIRGQGSDAIATSHTSGDTAAVYKATLAATVPFSTGDPVAMMRIETSTSHMNYGLAIGLDHPGASNMDIANNNVRSVAIEGACVAGLAVGNGTSGNILDQWGYGITVAFSGYGVLMNGGAISLHGADFGQNLVDIKRGQPVLQPIRISDVRSELVGRFYEFDGGYTSAPMISFDDCIVTGIFNEELVQIQHKSSGPVVLSNCAFYISSVTSNYAQLQFVGPSPTNPCHLVAINVAHYSPSTDPFIGSNVTKKLLNIFQMDSAGAYLASTPTLSGSVVTIDATQTLTNTRVTPRIGTVASSATPTINTDNVDQFNITALAAAITSMTTNLSGTPTDGQPLVIRITGDATPRAITWGASFQSSGSQTLLATTAASKTHRVELAYNSAAAKWVCIYVDATGY